METQASKTFFK